MATPVDGPASWDPHARTLHRVALAAARPSSPALFAELVREMADSLGASAGLIAVFTDETRTRVRTVTALLDGRLLTPFEYALAGTPCEQVVGSEFRHVARGLMHDYRASSLFAAKGMDSYAAYPLCDSHGERLGLLATMDREPLADVALAEAVLKIIGSRITAELERTTTEGVLKTAALAVSSVGGATVFADLARSLAEILHVDVAFIARPAAADAETMDVLAMQLDGGPVEYGSYALENTPCAGVLSEGFRVYPDRLADCFPGEPMLQTGVVAYAGYPLNDLAGQTLGLVAIASRVPLRRLDRLESVMQVFAVRAAAEIERLRADETVRKSEESYRTIFESIEDGLVVHDWHTGALVDMNPKACATSGFLREDVLGAPLSVFCSRREPYTEADARRHLQLAREGHCPPYEWRGRKADGSIAWFEVRLKSVSIGGVPRILSMSRDITEKKNAEEALRLREEQYRAIFEASSDAFVLRDAKLDIVDVNPAFLQLYGFTREQLAARGGYPETFPTGYVAERRERVERALRGEESRIETIALRPDGSTFEADLRVIPVRYRGEPHVLSVVRDITERRQRERELQRSEARLRATVEAAFDCIVGMDGDGRIVEFNAAAERCFGHARSAVLGRLLSDVIIPAHLRSGHSEGLRKFAHTGEGPFVGRLVETTALRADGSEFPIELAISVAAASEGNIYVGHLRDITARRQAEIQRSELEGQLRQAQKMEAIGQLTGGIAHDFNNILTSVTGYIVLASERAERIGAADLVRQLGQAHLAAQRARDLISQMLAFARRQRSERRPLALAAELRQSAQLLRSTLPSSVELHTALDRSAPAVVGDSVQIEQVLFNLCINARDAISGAGAIRIGLGSETLDAVCASCRAPLRGAWVVLSVADTGIGVSDAVRERMFEPFFTTKPVGRGSGMGLAMVHGIVHDHGGHVLIDAVEPHGTRFRVLLPPATTAPLSPVEHPHAPGPAALAGRILLVEDEAMVAAFMAELLAGWGFDVTHCSDPLEAEDCLAGAGSRFDVVLTDQTMPGRTGIELAERVAALRPELPVLLYSGFGEGIDAGELKRSSVRALLRKPIEPQALRSALAEALGVPA
jgi:PAS domain S-box-containing protein